MKMKFKILLYFALLNAALPMSLSAMDSTKDHQEKKQCPSSPSGKHEIHQISEESFYDSVGAMSGDNHVRYYRVFKCRHCEAGYTTGYKNDGGCSIL